MQIYLESYGCAMNSADSTLILEQLTKQGHLLVNNPHKAQVLILNTCTVRMSTEGRMIHSIRRLDNISRKNDAKLVVAGCMAKAQPALIKSIAPDAILITPQAIDQINKAVMSLPESIYDQNQRSRQALSGFVNFPIFTIPIAEGCMRNCTYCIVKRARGKLQSFPSSSIVSLISKAVKKGAKEIRLTAQDTGCYGQDIGEDLPSLLEQVCNIQGDFKIRIGMMNPDSAIRILPELIKSYQHEKVFKFLHIPVQSGSNEILQKMKRYYTVDDFFFVINEFRKRFTESSIATDIIVGFPGETEEAFQGTMELIQKSKPDKTHVARYSLRPFTEAASLPQMPWMIKKERSAKLAQLRLKISFEQNRKRIGKRYTTLITGRTTRNQLLGRIQSYKPVVIRDTETKDDSYIGQSLQINITEAKPVHLFGEFA